MINTPHNPSGACLTPADFDHLAQMIRDTPIVVLSDEVYEHMVFDGRRHHSVHLRPALHERSVVVASFGKTYHVTGWKIGYCVAAPLVSAEIRKLHQFVTFAISHPMQLGLADFCQAHPEWDQNLPAFYQAKRDRLVRGLLGSGFEVVPSPATYFQVVDYSALSDLGDVDFVRQLIRQFKVAAIPLSVFYADPPPASRIRLCFAKSDAVIDEAVTRLRQVT